jgi:two-component system, OmpR family, sensor kinase
MRKRRLWIPRSDAPLVAKLDRTGASSTKTDPHEIDSRDAIQSLAPSFRPCFLHRQRTKRLERARMTDNEDHQQLVAELKSAIAARDEFIATAAHELRNPMTPVLGQVQLLLSMAVREGASPAFVSRLERLERAIGHYVRRASVLLEISRLNAGKFRIEPTAFDMTELLDELIENYRTAASHAGSSLEWVPAGPVQGAWDRLSIEQVVDNLLSNAIRYGDGKPVRLSLAHDNREITICVTDEGVGIAPQDCSRIFDHFERVIGNNRNNGGFGLGLWLVRRLVEAQNGSIAVISAPGAGSAFTVRLPRFVIKERVVETSQ